MRRVLLYWGSVPIYSFPVLLYVGIVLGLYAQLYAASLIGLDLARTLVVTLLVLTTALLGARLLFVITNWPVYRDDPRRIWQFSEGGASMYGGLLLALPLSLLLVPWFGIPIGAYWDVACFLMLTGMTIGRAGCLLNGCCAGQPTSCWFGLNLPDHNGVWQRRIPTQVLESVWTAIVLAGAWIIWRHLPFEGALFFYSIVGYSAGRVVVDPARNKQCTINRLSLTRTIALGFVTISLIAFAIGWWRTIP